MSQVFFEELGIPEPEYNLGVGSGSHGEQTGAMLGAIERVLLAEKPDWALVYGDTNSTLAGALAAAKLHIPVAHVEAGLRSFNRRMPEEINRVLCDHAAELLLCPTQTAVDNLKAEGITQGVHLVGDVMYEALTWAVARGRKQGNMPARLGLKEKGFLLATVHRAENTDNPGRLKGILEAFNQLDEELVWPVHPRTRAKLAETDWRAGRHVRLVEPVGYLAMACLESAARLMLTDSGGMQKEAMWLGTPCVTLREETEWVETVERGWNVLAGAKTEAIVKAAKGFKRPGKGYSPKGLGRGAAKRCVEIMARMVPSNG
jgi:UDP-N-acetylglucosamine 2-epimerase